MRFWLIDLPARLFALWWTVYLSCLAVLVMVTVTITALSLALALFGVRWGW